MDPPDFNFENIGDILGSLSQEDIEKISSIAGQFMSGEAADKAEGCDCGDEGGFFGGFFLFLQSLPTFCPIPGRGQLADDGGDLIG